MKEIIFQSLKVILSRLVGIPSDAIASDVSFLDLGADSFVLVAMARQIKEKWGTNVSVRELFETCSTIEKLTALLTERATSTDKACVTDP